MIQTVVTAFVFLALAFVLIRIAMDEGKRRARSELESENAKKHIEARNQMDKAMRSRIGKRWKLVEWARKRVSGSSD